MSEEMWQGVDLWFEAQLLGRDEVLERVLARMAAAGLPAIEVSPLAGRFLGLLVKIAGARRVLEVGTLGGYSAICMGRALPEDGRLVTLELEAAHAAVARENLAEAGLAEKVEVWQGRAIDSLNEMIAAGEPAFDLVFIDADKRSCPAYLAAALQLSHVGTIIVVDNVVRGGRVIDPDIEDPGVRGVQEMVRDIAALGARVSATALQTTGRKGWDGLLLLRVEAVGGGADTDG